MMMDKLKSGGCFLILYKSKYYGGRNYGGRNESRDFPNMSFLW